MQILPQLTLPQLKGCFVLNQHLDESLVSEVTIHPGLPGNKGFLGCRISGFKIRKVLPTHSCIFTCQPPGCSILLCTFLLPQILLLKCCFQISNEKADIEQGSFLEFLSSDFHRVPEPPSEFLIPELNALMCVLQPAVSSPPTPPQ